jgi:hypothetical protein
MIGRTPENFRGTEICRRCDKVHTKGEIHYAKRDALPVRRNAGLLDIPPGEFFGDSRSVWSS